jgi:tetratricopeptide (TPR) repeat protein
LAPGEPIPRDLILATAELSTDGPEALLHREDALLRLIALGLLECGTTGTTLRLHRLLAIFVRARTHDVEAQAAVERALLRIAIERSSDASLSSLLAMQPHLRRVADAASERGDAQAARLRMVLGDHLMRLGDYLGARADYSQALAIRQERLGDGHADTVASMHATGLAHKERGEYPEAQRYFEQALAASRRVKGDRDLLTAAGLSTLGFVLKDQGRYTEAQRHFAEALKITRALRGQAPETAVCLNNLGLLYKDQGKYATAKRYFVRARDLTRAVQDDSGLVASLNNLAFVLKDQGRHVEAQRYFEQSLAINLSTWGEEHAETATSLNNLAFVLVDQVGAAWRDGGRGKVDRLFAEARGYLERALAIQENILPEGHPRRAEGLDSLGEVLDRQGNHEAAQKCLERALAIRLKVLGEWHVETARNLSSLGRVLAAQGDPMWSLNHLPQAKCYLEQSVAVFDRILGPTHPSPDAARTRAMLEEVTAGIESKIKSRDYLSSWYAAGNSG